MSMELIEQVKARASEILGTVTSKVEAERCLQAMVCQLVGCERALVEVGWWPELNDRRASILPYGDWCLGPIHVFV